MSDVLIVADTDTDVLEVEVQSVVTVDGQGDFTIVTSDIEIEIVTVEGGDVIEVAPETTVNVDILTVGEQGPPGVGGGGGDATIYEQRSDIISDFLVYRAEAELGTTDNDALVWRIRMIEITYDGENVSTLTKWAEGEEGFVHSWADRLTYTYS